MPGRNRDDDDDHDVRKRTHSGAFPPLPPWIARRRLVDGEEVTWVHGPESRLGVERYITHIGLFFVAIGIALCLLAIGWTAAGSVATMSMGVGMSAVGIVLGSVFVLGLANGHYTRLIVTNRRLLITQGYEVVRSWSIEKLPRSLVRYGPRRAGHDDEMSRTVDLDALKSILGGNKDQSATSKGIMALGKQVDRIRAHEREAD